MVASLRASGRCLTIGCEIHITHIVQCQLIRHVVFKVHIQGSAMHVESLNARLAVQGFNAAAHTPTTPVASEKQVKSERTVRHIRIIALSYHS